MTNDWMKSNDQGLDENSDWRDIRELMELSRYMEMEEEDYLEIVTDGSGKDEEIEGMDQADWAMKWVSEDLADLYEETGDVWVMIYQEDHLEPIMHVDEEKIVISPDYNPDFNSNIEIDGQEYNLSPIVILENTGYGIELLYKDYEVEEISERPRLEHEDNLEKISDDFLQGKFAAPGLEKKYYEKAEKAIERFVTRNASEYREE